MRTRFDSPPLLCVAGFLFNESLDAVLLLEKKKPTWQAGLLNGVGGKVEPRETIYDAMSREGFEESGVNPRWMHFVSLIYPTAEIAFFAARDEVAFQNARQMEAERLVRTAVCMLRHAGTIPNLRFLVPMAIHALAGEPMVPTGIHMHGEANSPLQAARAKEPAS